MAKVTKDQLLANPANFLALGAGSGLAPKAPGTFGTLAAIPIFYLMPQSLIMYCVVVIVMFVIGVKLCDACANNLGVHDHPAIVFDEWVGYLITMIAAPRSLMIVALGFVLFRIFDVLKPWPIGKADEKIEGGLGIMVDDVLAGLLAAIALQLILFVLNIYGVVGGALDSL